ncbi:MAG: hypothetical protein KatS3mg008_1319 [Acidimicrobiales bacterium]|nr:MAG: hypothetical protein KatS3mg008_1319 [Acidimicrobiales bacterium]
MSDEQKISKRRRGELLRALFEVLMEHPDGLHSREAISEVQKRIPFTEYELGYFPSNPNETRGAISIRFYTIGCVKAGWMTKSRAAWRLTEEGKKAFSQYRDPEEFMREIDRRYKAWAEENKDTSKGGEQETSVDEDVDEPRSRITVEIAQDTAWAEIERHLSEIDPYEFQDLVAALLRAMGYHVAWVAPPGPDRGIDIVAHTDPLGASGPRIKVQVKRKQDKTGAQEVRSFLAVLGPNDVGIFISTGGFSSDAEIEVRSQENRRITLIDMEKLVDLWISYYDRLREEDKRMLPLQAVYFLAPED